MDVETLRRAGYVYFLRYLQPTSAAVYAEFTELWNTNLSWDLSSDLRQGLASVADAMYSLAGYLTYAVWGKVKGPLYAVGSFLSGQVSGWGFGLANDHMTAYLIQRVTDGVDMDLLAWATANRRLSVEGLPESSVRAMFALHHDSMENGVITHYARARAVRQWREDSLGFRNLLAIEQLVLDHNINMRTNPIIRITGIINSDAGYSLRIGAEAVNLPRELAEIQRIQQMAYETAATYNRRLRFNPSNVRAFWPDGLEPFPFAGQATLPMPRAVNGAAAGPSGLASGAAGSVGASDLVAGLGQTVIFTGPVDVDVFDESGALVGQVVDGEVTYGTVLDTDSPLFATVDGQARVFMFPAGREYRFEVQAAEFGVLGYHAFVSDVEGNVHASHSIASMPIDQGDTFETGSDREVDGAGYAYLVRPGTGERATIVVTVEPGHGGSAYLPTGGHLVGENVTVAAVADDGYEFTGWYEAGVRVYDEPVYTFQAATDRRLEARFAAAPIMCEYEGLEHLEADDPECVEPVEPEMCEYYGLTHLYADDPLCVEPQPEMCQWPDLDHLLASDPLCVEPYEPAMCQWPDLDHLLASDPLCVEPYEPAMCEYYGLTHLYADDPGCVEPVEPVMCEYEGLTHLPADDLDCVRPAPARCEPLARRSFRDVAPGSAFHCYIEWMSAEGVSGGWPDGTFRPRNTVTREQLSAFLFRIAGGDDLMFTGPSSASFRDKPATSPFFTYVEWLAGEGISGGWPDRTFRPRNTVTREQLAAFLYRMAGSPAFTPPTQATFSDVREGTPFFVYVEWLASTGITTGWPDGTFRPRQTVSREVMSAFLWRAVNSAQVIG